MTKAEEIKKLKQELKELRIKAQPLNTAIYIKECEVFTLEEELKESVNKPDNCEECGQIVDGIHTGEPRWCSDCQ